MDNKVGVFNYVAEPFHVDFNSELTLGILGNHLLNCTENHAAQRGFGISKLNKSNYTWVISRLRLEMNEMPKKYEHFTIKTWVERVYRLFTDRNYEILNEEGKPIGYGKSVWAMINMETRQPANLIDLHGGNVDDYVYQRPCPIDKPSRIKLKEGKKLADYQTRYCDIDMNGHVNSIKYIEHVLNLFDLDLYKSKRIKRFEIAYVSESYVGDILSFYSDKVSETEYNIEIKKNDETVVCRSKVVWE